MKKRLFATTLTMALAAPLTTGCGSEEAVDGAAPVVAEVTKTEGGENSKGAGNNSDAAVDKAGTVADKTGPSGGAGILISVAMPTKDLQRWNQDGANMEVELGAANYEVDLQYANNDVQIQVSQIESMISNGRQMLVITSTDGSPLDEPLGQAKGVGIPITSYDCLIVNSGAVTHYVTFGNHKVGWKQGEYLVRTLGLETATESRNIELFTDDPAGNNCNFFFGGTMDVLQECIGEGKLVARSGQAASEQVATANWDFEKAQDRMGTIITENYSGGTALDAALCPNDSTTLGMRNTLASSCTGIYPVIVGRDCDIANVRNMLSGKQAMSAFKSTRTPTVQVVKMVDVAMQGGEAEINDSSSYDDGTGVVSTCLCEPVVITVDNYKEMLVDSGYYTEDQIEQISAQKRIPLPVKRRGKTNFRDD